MFFKIKNFQCIHCVQHHKFDTNGITAVFDNVIKIIYLSEYYILKKHTMFILVNWF